MDSIAPWSHRCYILASPRTGSTLLTYWLNQSVGLSLDLPEPSDPLYRLTFGEHFNAGRTEQTAAAFLAVDPIVSKLQANWRAVWLMPWEMPRDVRLIHLVREDVEAQARSLHHANVTGIVKVPTEDEAERHRESLTEPTAGELDATIRQVREWQKAWQSHLHVRDSLTITYEQLIANPTLAVGGLLHWLDVPQRANCSPVPLAQLH